MRTQLFAFCITCAVMLWSSCSTSPYLPEEGVEPTASAQPPSVHDALLVDVVPASDGEPEVRLFAYGLLEATDEQLDLLGLSREDVATRLPAGTDDTVLGYSQGLFYAGDCWASGAGSDWRQSPPNSGDWDFHSLFKVSNTKPYWVYASVALWAYLAATHKPLLWGRDPGLNRVWVNLGSYGYLAQYSAWVRSTNPCL